MTSLITRHLLNGLITLFLIVSLTFFLLRIMPGGPFDQERQLPPAIMANMNARFGLDKPLHEQYFSYLAHVVRGDLGPSYKYMTRSVNDIVAQGALVSFELGAAAVFMGTLAGIAMALLAAWATGAGTRGGLLLDGLFSLLGVSALSMPSFIFGAFMVLLFATWLNWLPAARLETPAHAILPVLTLSMVPFAYSFLLVRNALNTINHATFIQIKHAYGLNPWRVLAKHALKNALIPLLSIMAPLTAALVTGSFAVELIFAVPGLGKHFIYAVSNRDYTLVIGITLVYSVVLILLNMATELLYGVVNPKLRST